jgi:hypothetical protein
MYTAGRHLFPPASSSSGPRQVLFGGARNRTDRAEARTNRGVSPGDPIEVTRGGDGPARPKPRVAAVTRDVLPGFGLTAFIAGPPTLKGPLMSATSVYPCCSSAGRHTYTPQLPPACPVRW